MYSQNVIKMGSKVFLTNDQIKVNIISQEFILYGRCYSQYRSDVIALLRRRNFRLITPNLISNEIQFGIVFHFSVK